MRTNLPYLAGKKGDVERSLLCVNYSELFSRVCSHIDFLFLAQLLFIQLFVILIPRFGIHLFMARHAKRSSPQMMINIYFAIKEFKNMIQRQTTKKCYRVRPDWRYRYGLSDLH